MPKKEGLFCMSWAKTFLDLPGAGKLPLSIDQTSFMPLLTCFHDANKVVKQMANPCVTDDINPQLSKQAKTLLRMHCKLGHLGFQHLRWLLRHIPLFGAKGWIGNFKDCDAPFCSSFIQGGMQRRPIAGDTHTQKP